MNTTFEMQDLPPKSMMLLGIVSLIFFIWWAHDVIKGKE